MVTWADIEGNPESNDDLMNLFDGKSNKIVDRKDLNGNYTLQEEDADHLLVMTQEGDVTVPADELPVNSAVVLTKSTGDDVNIIAGSGVTFLPAAGGYVIPEEWIFITLFHASQNTWVLQGTVSDDLQTLLEGKAALTKRNIQEASFGCTLASQTEEIQLEEGTTHFDLRHVCSRGSTRRLTIDLQNLPLEKGSYLLLTIYSYRENTDTVNRGWRTRIRINGENTLDTEYKNLRPGKTYEARLAVEVVRTAEGWVYSYEPYTTILQS